MSIVLNSLWRPLCTCGTNSGPRTRDYNDFASARSSPMSRSALLAAGCAIVALNLVVAAQQPQPSQSPVFRLAIDLVHLDVSVLDRDRRPVRGLTEKDFTVLEDGQPQPIVVFSA